MAWEERGRTSLHSSHHFTGSSVPPSELPRQEFTQTQQDFLTPQLSSTTEEESTPLLGKLRRSPCILGKRTSMEGDECVPCILPRSQCDEAHLRRAVCRVQDRTKASCSSQTAARVSVKKCSREISCSERFHSEFPL